MRPRHIVTRETVMLFEAPKAHTCPTPEGSHHPPTPGSCFARTNTHLQQKTSLTPNQMDPIDRWSTGFEQALKALGLSADDFPTLPFLRSLAAPYQSVQAFYSSLSGAGRSCDTYCNPLRSCIHPGRVHLAPYVGKSSLLNAVLGSVPAAEIVTEGWFREGGGLLYTSEFMRGTDSPSYLSPR